MKIAVKIPEGCLLVQAGKQLEWMTGGYIKAGFHEVVCTQATLDVSLPIAAIGPQAYICRRWLDESRRIPIVRRTESHLHS
jgi:hypothetical protein